MVVFGHVLLDGWLYMCSVVAAVVFLQCNAGFVPAVRDGGDHRAVAGSAGREGVEGGAEGEAPGGVCAWDCHGGP